MVFYTGLLTRVHQSIKIALWPAKKHRCYTGQTQLKLAFACFANMARFEMLPGIQHFNKTDGFVRIHHNLITIHQKQ
jgi:hypothetical protein